MKIKEGALQQGRVDVAAAKCRGLIGEKEREGEKRKTTAQIETEALIFETTRQRDIEESNTKLAIERIEFGTNVEIAEMQAKRKSEMRDAELQRELELKQAKVNEEKFRAEKLTKAIVEAENIKVNADANQYKLKQEADAKYYEAQTIAKATQLLYEARAIGIEQLNTSFQGDKHAIIKYLFLDRGVLSKIANANSNALSGLNPDVTVWNTELSE